MLLLLMLLLFLLVSLIIAADPIIFICGQKLVILGSWRLMLNIVLWGGVVGFGMQSHLYVNPNLIEVELGLIYKVIV